jgi:hypothetical protein
VGSGKLPEIAPVSGEAYKKEERAVLGGTVPLVCCAGQGMMGVAFWAYFENNKYWFDGGALESTA